MVHRAAPHALPITALRSNAPPTNMPAASPTPAVIVDGAGNPSTVSEFLDSGYGYYPGLAWPAVGILFAFIVLFRIISSLAVSACLGCIQVG